ncbi:ABC transporter ATP-binding protein/permease [Enterococcus alishanensis]|uniref:ABC transporter ATP-binding protein/permease n=1 Tax=Enterococcus alishanensis TaxID=1303817 RepID=A0ABS6T9R4_9ENTE|nr:ABC transporter ATP-binding protein/permease [Enterococcus alishanensis]MBV7389647.1 ABC transporter ATP-binding protein/permease [Enterococcus alishanensis]
MIDQRLFKLTEKKNLIKLVLVRLFSLALSIIMWWQIAGKLANYLAGEPVNLLPLILTLIAVIILKALSNKWSERLTYRASADLRLKLRHQVMTKAFRLGKSQEQLPQATLAQLSVDGIEQLEIYYARFLPQLFYCVLASLLIFATLVQFAVFPAIILLICMPLIPVVIMSVMKIAKKILDKYWTRYTDLGAKFHENLSGLATLKAYHQDEARQKNAKDSAEQFRKITMRLLSMQLNSITVMDIISYSGAALGIGLALISYQNGQISIMGVLMFVLLGAEFFIPMRQLGSLFHVAMNGISACKKLFDYLALPEQIYGEKDMNHVSEIQFKHVDFGYTDYALALKDVSLEFKKGHFTAIVGQSGSGKSTLVQLMLHRFQDYQGQIVWDQLELQELSHKSLTNLSTLVDNKGYIYPMSIRDNLLLGNKTASETELWRVLSEVQLIDFVKGRPYQLDEILNENGSDLSGGQRQRLLLARALLKKSDVYIFDEITSGVDLASEEIILDCLKQLAQKKIIIFISHRLYNVLSADQIYVFENGRIVEAGTPEELQAQTGYFNNYFAEEVEVFSGGQ